MVLTDSGNSTAVSAVQPQKAASSISVRVAGREMSVSAVQPQNTYSPMVSRELPRLTDASLVHSAKA